MYVEGTLGQCKNDPAVRMVQSVPRQMAQIVGEDP